jgi:hypothetical protein
MKAATPARRPLSADAEQPRHREVLRCRPHLHAHPCPVEERAEADEQNSGYAHGDEFDRRDRVRADVDGLGEKGVEGDASRQRTEQQDRQVLEQEADRERGDEEGVGVGAACVAERDAFHRDGRNHHQPEHDEDADRPRRADDEREPEGTDHDQFAVREIDEAHDPEQQTDAEGEEREEAPEADAVDRVFDGEVNVHWASAPRVGGLRPERGLPSSRSTKVQRRLLLRLHHRRHRVLAVLDLHHPAGAVCVDVKLGCERRLEKERLVPELVQLRGDRRSLGRSRSLDRDRECLNGRVAEAAE